MKVKKITALFLCVVLAVSMLAGCGGANNTSNNVPDANTNDVQPGPAVSEEEMTALSQLSAEGLEVIGVDRLNEGRYDITVLSGSEQFRIKSSKLVVVGNALQLVLEVEGDTYSKMFAGKAAEAAGASDIVEGESTGEGTTTFRIPVKSLNEVMEVSAYADEYGKWFDRTLLAMAGSLDSAAIKPVEAADTGNDDKKIDDDKKADDKKTDDKKSDSKSSSGKSSGGKSSGGKSSGGKSSGSSSSSTLKDGEYTVEVAFSGGTGKAKISSPAKLHVKNGKMTVTVVWTSKYYDYMKVNGKKYMNENKGGYSTFTFPISALGKNMKVIGDTTAMSTPHEIEYTVKFTLKK